VIAGRIERDPRITVLINVAPVEFRGGGKLETVVLENLKSNERREIHTS
jgi:hypothetical protein